VLGEDSEGVHAQKVGCIAVFVVLDFDFGVARKATAGNQSDIPGSICPITMSLSIGKRDGEHVPRRLIGGIAK